MKKIIAFILALTLVFSMAACASKPAEDTTEDETITDTENVPETDTDAETDADAETDTDADAETDTDAEEPVDTDVDADQPATPEEPITNEDTTGDTAAEDTTGDTAAELTAEEQEVLDTVQQLVAGAADEIMCDNIIISSDHYPYYLFIDYIEGSIAASSSAMIGSIPHSVVLLKLPEDADVAAVAAEIEENMDPRKWICVEAEATMVKTSGQYVLMVMSSQATVDAISANFDTVFGA